MAAPQASSRLEMLQARFQQRQLLEKEQKLLQLYDQQQLRAHQVAQRGSAGSNGSNSSSHGSNHQTVTRTSTSTHSTSNSQGGGKVRQMFDERRQTTVKGIDKSYPLEPLDSRSRKHQISTSNVVVASSTSTSPQKNTNPGSNRIVTRRTVRSEANSNVNNGKPIVTYREEVSREIGDTIDRDYDQGEFGDENVQISQYGNGNRPIDRPTDLDFESVTSDNANQRHRTTAKIHLSEFDRSNGNDRTVGNLEDERFPDDHSIDVPERLQRRGSATKRTSEAEARFERFKNSNTKKIGQPIKQVAGNTTSYTKKRNESTVHSGTSSRASTVTRTMEEEETSRANSTSPEYEVVVRTRKSSPEVPRDEIKKTSGITKVSQICHKSTSDYYPRRKSEFEKSKTFRKLQLELGESSPEPIEVEDTLISYGKPCKKRSTILDANVYSPDRRSSSLSPTTGSNDFNGRRDGREKSPGKEFQCPVYRTGKKIIKNEETTRGGMKTSKIETSTYTSRRRSSSSSRIVDHDFSKERRMSREKSLKHPDSRAGSPSPLHWGKSSITKEETYSSKYENRNTNSEPSFVARKTSHERSPGRTKSRQGSQSPSFQKQSLTTRMETRRTSFEPDTSYTRRSSSPSANVTRNCAKNRKLSHEKSPEHSRGGFDIPIYRRGSTTKNEECKKATKTSRLESSTYYSRQHDTSPSPDKDDDFSKDRKLNRDKSPEGPISREGFDISIYRRGSTTKNEECKTGMKTSRLESSTYSSRQHASSPSPDRDDDFSKDRKFNHEKSPERPISREGFDSPIYRRGSSTKNEECKIGMKTSRLESSTYSSRQHASSPSPDRDDDFSKDRKLNHDKSPERPISREGFDGPIYRRGSRPKNEECKTGMKTSRLESSTYSSRQHASSPSPDRDDDFSKDQKLNHDKSPERPISREGFDGPIYRRGSSTKKEECKIGMKTSRLESSTYSSRQHASSPSPDRDDDFSKDQKLNHDKSPERPISREGFDGPIYRRGSRPKNEECKTGMKTSRLESSTYSSRQHASSPSPDRDDDFSKDRKLNHDKSPERRIAREGFDSRISRRGSTTKNEECQSGMKTSRLGSRTYSSRRQALSPSPTYGDRPTEEPRASNDNEKMVSDRQRKSGGTLRSVELVKKLVRPSSRETKTTTTSTEKSCQRKTILEDIEFPSRSSNIPNGRTRSTSPEHKIVKKDKAAMEPSKEEESAKSRGNEKSRDTRSRAISPSPLSSGSMKETASFRAKKNERKNSSEAKKNALNAENRINLPDGNDSRRSSAEIRVNRHDTFRVNKPCRRILTIDNEEPSDQKENLPIDRQVRIGTNDKSELLEKIEKIRCTLSRTGRSEQNLQSKEFERTDSVESALRRFDSIGVETEHHVTVGVDETDILRAHPCSETILSSKDERTSKDEKFATKKSTDSRNKSDKMTVAVVKARPRKNNSKSREPSREKISRLNLQEKDEGVGKSAKGKKERSSMTIATPRQSGNKVATKSRPVQKSATSIVKKSKLQSEESSGRGEGGRMDDSPLCKRKLFQDSESEIGTDNKRSAVVLTTITRTTKESPKIVKIETGDDVEKRGENIVAENEPAKILRSIEDIRKSIKRESQDFKRELNKFNTVMRGDVENSGNEIPDSVVTSGIVSRVQITKTMKADDPVPVIKIEKSIVKLPITHRVAKSPSPDIGSKRTTDGRARSTTTTTTTTTTAAATTTVRRSVPSSPAKSPDTTNRYGSSELRIPSAKSSTKPSSSPGSREMRNQTEYSTTAEYSTCTDNPANDSEVTVAEFVSTVTTTKNNEAFTIELEDDDELSRGKDNASSYRGKPPLRKKSSERSLTSQRQQRSPSATPLPRPTSALSTASSGSLARGCHQTLHINSKSKMSTKSKSPTSGGQKGATPASKGGITSSSNDGLAPCKICGRRFNSERVTLHEQICSKTATKKRKQFDATIHRVKGTELESFVIKKGVTKKPAERKAQKPETKSNWRRKHEDFINAIRSAKQVQAHLAAGGKLSDLPPPPPSDTSDYIQCPHCGRKFNQGAAERHIPKCQTMMHNKPNSRAPPKPKR